MTNVERMTNDEGTTPIADAGGWPWVIGNSSLGILSSFVIRHSSFLSHSPKGSVLGHDLDGIAGRVGDVARTGAVAVRLQRAELLGLGTDESNVRRVLLGDHQRQLQVGKLQH